MSNLIEQLGGYAAAKRAIENGVLKDLAPCTYEVARRCSRSSRRANNIFEVGDSIVIHEKYDSTFMHVLEILEDYGSSFRTSDCTAIKSHSGYWRHATDAEIKAGHRLPQLEVLDDIDIPPNTIILGDK